MKLRTLFTLIWLLAVAGFANITGTLDFSGAGVLNPLNTKVAFRGATYPVASNGQYVVATVGVKDRSKLSKSLASAYDLSGRKINLNQPQSWSNQLTSIKQYTYSGFAGRSMGVNDTLYIVVNGDTLREVPVTSWDTVLPPNYVVQRNVGVTVPVTHSSETIQVVWWNTDSIAHVLDLGKASTNNQKYSGYIYTVYDDAAFRANARLYSLFVRTRTADSIKSYTGILDVKARAGDLIFAEADFSDATYHTVAGYSLTPNDSSVSRFNLSKTVSMTYVTDSTFDTLNYDSTYFAYAVRQYSPEFYFKGGGLPYDTIHCDTTKLKSLSSGYFDPNEMNGGTLLVRQQISSAYIAPIKDTTFNINYAEIFYFMVDSANTKLTVYLNGTSDPIVFNNVHAGVVITVSNNVGNAITITSPWVSDFKVKVIKTSTKSYWKL
jgi:hypothetical protein